MNSTPGLRLQSLFAEALELPPAGREAFLRQVCGNDTALLQELRNLLAADERLTSMTAQPAVPAIASAMRSLAPASMTGQRVGAFELREELGHGGMGRVYRAERVDGTVTQEVAIKFVRRELLDANTLRRFQLERQLMATLDHPNIARLIDAAELEDGTPYFVMEYVSGVPITTYCARQALGLRDRLSLLRRVCAAVAEAHRELIVHRDLKPGNILITGNGTPKLLDFGIAKPLGVGMANEETGTAQRYFSPQYAAPEQIGGAPVGIACDVYALGLLAYELVSGRRAYELQGLTTGQIERLILSIPPAPPSAALARNDDAPPGIRARQLRGDVDGIVQRCLRKVPGERYASVDQLDADLANYLEGRPVQARGGHRWYRIQKFVRRNALLVAAGALTTVALIAGVASFAWQARIAQRRAAELEQVSQFQAEMLAQVEPVAAGRLLTEDIKSKFEAGLVRAGVPEAEHADRVAAFMAQWEYTNPTDAARDFIDQAILRPAANAIPKQFADQPLVDASLSQVLAERYRVMGLIDAAAPLQERALATRRRLLGEDHRDTLISTAQAAQLMLSSDPAAAELLFRDALARSRRVLGEDHPDTASAVNNLGFNLSAQGKTAEAEPYYREALEKRRRILPENDQRTLSSINNVGSNLMTQGRLDEAEPFLSESLEKSARILGDGHSYTTDAIQNMGMLRLRQRRLDEAETFFKDALRRRRHLLGDETKLTLASLRSVGSVLYELHKLAEAEVIMREALATSRRVLGEEHEDTLRGLTGLGTVLSEQHKYTDVVALLEPAEPAVRKVFLPTDTRRLARLLLALGVARTALGQHAAAEPSLVEALELFKHNPASRVRDEVLGSQSLVDLYVAWDQAEPGKGYGGKAAAWKRTLDAIDASDPLAPIKPP
jgi:eukaryotic-like serine/threonine-protein kinase